MEKNDTTRILSQLKLLCPEAAVQGLALNRAVISSGGPILWERYVGESFVNYRAKNGTAKMDWGFRLKDESRSNSGYLFIMIALDSGAGLEFRNRFEHSAGDGRMTANFRYDHGKGQLEQLFKKSSGNLHEKTGFLEAAKMVVAAFVAL